MKSKTMKIGFIVFFIIIAFLFLLITWPFAKAAFLAFTLTVIFWPLYNFVLKKLNNHHYISSVITTIVVAVCVIFPLVVFGSIIVIKAGDFLRTVVSEFEGGSMSEALSPFFETIHAYISKLSGSAPLAKDIETMILSVLKQLSEKLYQYSPQVVSTAASITINFFLMFLFLAVFMAEGKKLFNRLINIVPLSKEHFKELSRNTRIAITSTLGATIMTAIVQGALLGLGFWVAGFENLLGWWLVVTIISVIPVIGAASCYITASIVLYATGEVLGAILFLLFGFGIVSSVDNIIRSFMIRGISKIHPFLLFVALIGSLKLMGPIGLIVGPVLVVVFLASLRIYSREFAKNR